MKKIYIGTSGFYYEHWRNIFYPEDLPKSHFFEYYMQRFNTVELNATFYHLPKLKTTEHWAKQTPSTFRFSLKAYRGITHYAKLKEVGGELYRFLHLIKPLKSKLGAILFQLPPSLHRDDTLLEEFLALLPHGYRYAIEFRHVSWLVDEIYELLRRFNVSLCLNDYGKRSMQPLLTADFTYFRFHGPDGRYGGCYDEKSLENWAGWIQAHSKELEAIYLYFNNDMEGYAVQNALSLRRRLEDG